MGQRPTSMKGEDGEELDFDEQAFEQLLLAQHTPRSFSQCSTATPQDDQESERRASWCRSPESSNAEAITPLVSEVVHDEAHEPLERMVKPPPSLRARTISPPDTAHGVADRCSRVRAVPRPSLERAPGSPKPLSGRASCPANAGSAASIASRRASVDSVSAERMFASQDSVERGSPKALGGLSPARGGGGGGGLSQAGGRGVAADTFTGDSVAACRDLERGGRRRSSLRPVGPNVAVPRTDDKASVELLNCESAVSSHHHGQRGSSKASGGCSPGRSGGTGSRRASVECVGNTASGEPNGVKSGVRSPGSPGVPSKAASPGRGGATAKVVFVPTGRKVPSEHHGDTAVACAERSSAARSSSDGACHGSVERVSRDGTGVARGERGSTKSSSCRSRCGSSSSVVDRHRASVDYVGSVVSPERCSLPSPCGRSSWTRRTGNSSPLAGHTQVSEVDADTSRPPPESKLGGVVKAQQTPQVPQSPQTAAQRTPRRTSLDAAGAGDGRGQPVVRQSIRQSGASTEELLDGPQSPRHTKVVAPLPRQPVAFDQLQALEATSPRPPQGAPFEAQVENRGQGTPLVARGVPGPRRVDSMSKAARAMRAAAAQPHCRQSARFVANTVCAHESSSTTPRAPSLAATPDTAFRPPLQRTPLQDQSSKFTETPVKLPAEQAVANSRATRAAEFASRLPQPQASSTGAVAVRSSSAPPKRSPSMARTPAFGGADRQLVQDTGADVPASRASFGSATSSVEKLGNSPQAPLLHKSSLTRRSLQVPPQTVGTSGSALSRQTLACVPVSRATSPGQVLRGGFGETGHIPARRGLVAPGSPGAAPVRSLGFAEPSADPFALGIPKIRPPGTPSASASVSEGPDSAGLDSRGRPSQTATVEALQGARSHNTLDHASRSSLRAVRSVVDPGSPGRGSGPNRCDPPGKERTPSAALSSQLRFSATPQSSPPNAARGVAPDLECEGVGESVWPSADGCTWRAPAEAPQHGIHPPLALEQQDSEQGEHVSCPRRTGDSTMSPSARDWWAPALIPPGCEDPRELFQQGFQPCGETPSFSCVSHTCNVVSVS